MDRLELPKSKYQIHRQIEIKNLSAFFYCHQKGENRYAAKRISQTAQDSVRHQDGRQRMAGGVIGRHPPLPDRQYAENAQLPVRAFHRHKKLVKRKEFEQFISEKLVI